MAFPAVSVLIPFKNTEKYIRRALDSVAAQTMDNFEVIMVDDGSSDDSRQVALKFCADDNRFKIYSGGQGLVLSLNLGLSVARGKWIARFDSDDICHPERLMQQLEAAEKYGNRTVISCRIRSFPDSAVRSGYRNYETWINSLTTSDEIRKNLFVESPVPHPSAFYNRDAVVEAGGYRDLGLPEDYELWLRLWSSGFSFFRVPLTLLAWRERSDRFSRTSSMYSLTAFYRTKAMYLKHVPCLREMRVYVAGTGQTARRLGREIQRQGFRIEAFLSPDSDSARRFKELRGCPVINISEWENDHRFPVIVASRKPGAGTAIQEYLEGRGLVNWSDFVLCS